MNLSGRQRGFAADCSNGGRISCVAVAWAADHGRVLLTHDVSTITAHAYRRIMKGDAMPGVFEVSRRVSVRSAAEDTILLSECSHPGEWEDTAYKPTPVDVIAHEMVGACW